MENTIRLLNADEIDCRVSAISEKGLSLLLYKNARADQKILDETFTMFGWKRSHQSIDGNLYCTVEIWDNEKKQWIGKQDVGTMSYSEKEKGQASDSFKRACFNIGIGRELYTSPFIWIPASKVSIQKKGDKFVTSEHFRVLKIEYNSQREICNLAIVNSGNILIYSYMQKDNLNDGKNGTIGISTAQMAALEKELRRTGVTLEAVLDRYHLMVVEQMTAEIYESAMNALKKSQSRLAA